MLEGVCTWAGEALQLAYEGGLLDDFSVTILRVRPVLRLVARPLILSPSPQLYANLSYGPSIFAQLAIVLHLESLPLRLFEPSMPYAPFSHSRVRFTAIACAFLRDIRVRSCISPSPVSNVDLPLLARRMTTETTLASSPEQPSPSLDLLLSPLSGTERLLGSGRVIRRDRATSSHRPSCMSPPFASFL